MTKIKKIISGTTTFGLALLTSAGNALASTLNIVPNDGIGNTVQGFRINNAVSGIIQILLGVAGIISFIMLLWGGLQWILSGGDKEGTEKARKRITAALIGLAVVFSAYALVFIIGELFGINTFQFTVPNITQTT